LIEDALRIQANIWDINIPLRMKGFSVKNYLHSTIDPVSSDGKEAVKLYKTMIKNFGRILSSAENDVLDVDQDVSLLRLSLELARLTAIYQRRLHSKHTKLILGPLDRIRINGIDPKRCYLSAEQLRAASINVSAVEQLQQRVKSQQLYLQHMECMMQSKDSRIADLQQEMQRLREEHSRTGIELERCMRELESKDEAINIGMLREQCLSERLRDYESRVDHAAVLLQSIYGRSSIADQRCDD